MRPVGAVLEETQAVIAPGPCKIDAAVRDAGLCRKAAVFKEEALRLLEGVGGSGGVTDIPCVAEGADLTVVEYSFAAAEYEVHGAFDEALLEILAAGDVPAQVIGQKAVVALDQIFRERTEEQSILGGSEPAVFHMKVIRVDSQSDLLSLCFRVQGVIHDSQVLHGDVVRADRHGPCPEGVVFFAVRMDLVRVVVPDDAGFVHAGAPNRHGRHENSAFYAKIAFRKLNKVTWLAVIQNGLKVVVWRQNTVKNAHKTSAIIVKIVQLTKKSCLQILYLS